MTSEEELHQDEPREEPPASAIERALEEFGRRLLGGERPVPARFAEEFAPELRAEVLERCGDFLRWWDVVSQGRPRSDPSEQPGARFGEYRVIAELGRGGMGIVHLAWDEELRRAVALKVLPRSLVRDERALQRFLREARAAARLEHPGIVSIYGSGEAEGTHYIAMEYVPGRTIEQILNELRSGSAPSGEPRIVIDARGFPAARQMAELVRDVVRALEFAHQHGVIHRDVKPQNVILSTDGRPRLVDFGLAKDLNAESISVEGELAGTYFYMSPEQALAKSVRIDHRTDVFSAGVLLYELLTLERPFTGDTPQEVLYHISFKDPVPVRRRNRRVPRDLAIICAKAMEKRPDDRYASAGDVAEDLQRFLDGRPILATPPSLRRRVVRAAGRHRHALTSGAASALLVGGAFAYFARDHRPMLTVRCDIDGARVLVRRVDEENFAPGAIEPLGIAPVVRRHLDLGVYRVVVDAPGVGFGERTVALVGAESEVELAIAVHRTEAVTSQGMVFFEAGSFVFGDGDGGPLATRQAHTEAFWIDVSEVSNREYLAFVDATGHRRPFHWSAGYRREWDDLPVVGVDVHDAQAYANWVGKRLPTVLEWERAARGTEGRPHPWIGEVPPSDCATWLLPRAEFTDLQSEMREEYGRTMRPVESCFELDSPEGVHHLYANAFEWTESFAFHVPEGSDARIPVGYYHKGASPEFAPQNWRMGGGAQAPVSGGDTFSIGFRCAKSQQP